MHFLPLIKGEISFYGRCGLKEESKAGDKISILNYVYYYNFYLMKKIFLIILSLLMLAGSASAQFRLKDTHSQLINTGNSGIMYGANSTGFHGTSTSGLSPAIYTAGIIFIVVNPMAVFENKKIYFGLTKEVSLGKYPYGRFAFEYTYVFRAERNSQIRLSYNLDYFIETGNFYAFFLSGGVGYFTDTKYSGVFPQVSFGALLPIPIANITSGLYPYIKARHTFVKGTENSNITDISLGVGFLLYY